MTQVRRVEEARSRDRFHAVITNIDDRPSVDIEAHHRLRGGIPEDTIRQVKQDSGLCHAPLQNSFGNWLWWHASVLAYNVARWIRHLALPAEFARCRRKRLRLAFFNVAARVVTTPANSAYVSRARTPEPTASSKRSPASEHSQRSPEPARHSHPTTTRTTDPSRTEPIDAPTHRHHHHIDHRRRPTAPLTPSPRATHPRLHIPVRPRSSALLPTCSRC